MRRKFLRDEGGFALPELLVVVTIMVVVLLAIYSIFDMSIKVFSFGNNKTEAVENARAGLGKMEREIRAVYPQDKAASPSNNTLLTNWTANSIAFGNDLDGNRKIQCVSGGTPPCETVSYSVYLPTGASSHALGRVNALGGDPQPVAEFVDYVSPTDTGLKLRYFQKDGTTEVSPGGDEKSIAIVRIELRVKVQRGTRPGTQTLTTDVALRNRGD